MNINTALCLIILVEDVVQLSKNLNYTIDDGLILTTSLFPAFLQVHVSETFVSIFNLTPTVRFLYWSFRCQLFNGFMYYVLIHRTSTAVGQVVACAPVTQRVRVRSPVGTGLLGEVFLGFLLTCKTNVRKL